MEKKNNKKVVINIEKDLYKYYKKDLKTTDLELRLLKEINSIDTIKNRKFKKESLYIDESILLLIDYKLDKSPLNISRTMFIVMTILKIKKENEEK